jgi:hypothetical protein
MKKLSIIISILFLCVLCAGCSEESKYDKAVEHYNNGEFTEAKEIFTELESYEDSDTYITKCEVMKKLQGTYIETHSGKPAFTIKNFKVLDWDDNTTLELNDGCTIVTFSCEEFGESEYSLSFEDSKPILESDFGLRYTPL